MAQFFKIKAFAAAGVLVTGVTAMVLAAQFGDLELGAGDLEMRMTYNADTGVALEIGDRSCPPECNPFDIDWTRRTAQASATMLKQIR